MSAAETTPQGKGLQSPKAITCRRFAGFNYGDSPGDVEPSQDIIWDSTSPTAASTGHRNPRIVEISDIVNRIAPKERKQGESLLLQWIGDSVSCTPEIPKQRVRRKSIRQNTVEDLVKLARQFDENMQDGESSAGVHNNSISDRHNASKPKLRSADKIKDLQCSSSSDRVEAELQALFDCSTQKLSGRLSPGSLAATCSQEVQEHPVAARLVETTHPRVESSEATSLPSNNDFDDDWENDDLLNDPLLLEVAHNPPQLLDKSKTSPDSNTKMETNQSHSGSQSTVRSMLSCSVLQELCPKPKTTTRSTFKLEPNPHFQAKDSSKPALTAVQVKPQISQMNSTKTVCRPDETTTCKTHTFQGISDSLWDNGDDDTLLYQVCDSVERISNTKLGQESFSHKEMHNLEERGQKCTTSMPSQIHTVASSVAKQESPRTFVRSNSLPATSSGAVNYRGWDVPMKGANNKPQMSQSLPGSHMDLGTFNQSKNTSGKLQAGSDGATKAKTSHTAFKRNFSDSAVTSNKVFVTSQVMGKCSAAEIERKKQEALARRRQRMQNGPKP